MHVCSPVGPSAGHRIVFADRPASLEGLRIGLLDNQKAPVDRILDHLRARLSERFPGTSFVSAAKKLTGHPAAEDVLRSLEGCDVVINALGD